MIRISFIICLFTLVLNDNIASTELNNKKHSSFNPLKKMGYQPVLVNQKTSLKKNCKNGNCLASEFDNLFYNTTRTKLTRAGILSFFKNFQSLEAARTISDHIPIWAEFDFR